MLFCSQHNNISGNQIQMVRTAVRVPVRDDTWNIDRNAMAVGTVSNRVAKVGVVAEAAIIRCKVNKSAAQAGAVTPSFIETVFLLSISSCSGTPA